MESETVSKSNEVIDVFGSSNTKRLGWYFYSDKIGKYYAYSNRLPGHSAFLGTFAYSHQAEEAIRTTLPT